MKRHPFFTKNILDVTSCGALLRHQRLELGRTLDQAAGALKIGKQYLKALEDEAYASIPGLLYAKRFFRAYAEWLGVPDAYQLFENRLHEKPREDRVLLRRVGAKDLMVLPRLLRYGVAAVACLALVGYLLVQVYIYLAPPKITLTFHAPLTHQKQVTVSGKATNTLKLFVNGEEAPVVNGSFQATATLVPGLNAIVVKAVNRVEKESFSTMSLYYAKAESETGDQISLR